MLYTVGHSNRTIDEFTNVLKAHGITAVADVRSQPYSRMNPQFDREALAASLNAAGIAYVFLGRELGARSPDASCYKDGKVQFDRLARAPAFKEGLERVRLGMQQFSVALMCAEKEPLVCHRAILVAREFELQGVPIRHILTATDSEDHMRTNERLLHELGLDEGNLFAGKTELIAEAYRQQAHRIAYERDETALAADARN